MKRFALRIPDFIHEKLREESHSSRKSINTIIVEILRDSYPDDDETIALEDLGLEGE